MIINWARLEEKLGTWPSGGTAVASQAIEYILGDESINAAVEIILDLRAGWLLADSVLVHIQSRRALDLAYSAYRSSSGERAVRAVWLIKELSHPAALAWIPEFLSDPNENVAAVGADVLDQLIFAQRADPETEEVEALLVLIETHSFERVQEVGASIRAYLKKWAQD